MPFTHNSPTRLTVSVVPHRHTRLYHAQIIRTILLLNPNFLSPTREHVFPRPQHPFVVRRMRPPLSLSSSNPIADSQHNAIFHLSMSAGRFFLCHPQLDNEVTSIKHPTCHFSVALYYNKRKIKNTSSCALLRFTRKTSSFSQLPLILVLRSKTP